MGSPTEIAEAKELRDVNVLVMNVRGRVTIFKWAKSLTIFMWGKSKSQHAIFLRIRPKTNDAYLISKTIERAQRALEREFQDGEGNEATAD